MRTSSWLAALALGVSAALAAPEAARAQSRTTLGVGSGAVAGALVAGPVGAVAGAVVGGLVGSASEPRRRRVRRRRHATVVPAPRTALPRPTADDRPVAATAWRDPE